MNQPERRAAVFGLLGALVGGAASLGGSYVSVHETTRAAAAERQEARITQQRTVYLDFATKANQYSVDLLEVSQLDGQTAYARVRDRLIREVAPLYTAYQSVLFTGPKQVSDKAGVVQGGLVQVYLPPRRADLDRKKLEEAVNGSDPQLVAFTTAASAAVANDGG